tara:strand:- start:9754 stop:10629 length:876 start_codon:yes stop_codon:yes gene_type:complete
MDPVYTELNLQYKDYNLVCYDTGENLNDRTIFLLNGGPGLPCNYLRDPHLDLAKKGYRIFTYDQLGCGKSSKPSDLSLWNIERYVEEVEFVRKQFDLGEIILLGHSWGGWLGIEYAIKYQNNINKLILENTCGDMPHMIRELDRLRGNLGSETVKMMMKHEAEGTLDHEEYQAAITILNYRHVCRLDIWPQSIYDSLDDWNMDVYGTMQGPNEFLYTGNLKNWNRIEEMKNINISSLVTVGMHDELTPSCAMKMHDALPDSKLKVFKNSSHMPFYEEPQNYFTVLEDFLSQ